MNGEEPVIARVSATNPVPDPDALTAEQRAAAEALRARIAGTPATPSRRGQRSRRIWHLGVAVTAIVPVAIVVIVLLGVQHRPGTGPGHGGFSALRLPPSGAAQTLLLIGSDHRAGEPYENANTDAMLLVRLDPSASTINVLSVPRDLEVRIPEGGTSMTAKLNSVYSIGGASLLLRILKTQVFPGLEVNHIIDFNFKGFSSLVDALGCVYGDVDHRYINDTAQTDYSSIDLQAGYQQLCGTQALQFVRFRHTDSDLVREARQQAFLRWVSGDFSIGDLLAKRDQLFETVGRYAQTDVGLHSVDGLIQLFNLAVNVAGHPLQQIPFPAVFRPCDASLACYVTATPANEAAAYQRFISTAPPSRSSTLASPRIRERRRGERRPGPRRRAGAGDGAGQPRPARVLPGRDRQGLELLLRRQRQLPRGTESCWPVHERIPARLPDHCRRTPVPVLPPHARAERGERRVLRSTGHNLVRPTNPPSPDSDRDRQRPPIARVPHRLCVDARGVQHTRGQLLVSNTLTNSIPSAELIAIAASMRPAG